MIIDAISDLHGYYPELPGGDILILGGDYTARDEISEWNEFYLWLKELPYKHKVYVAGNHDGFLEHCAPSSIGKQLDSDYVENQHYLVDEAVEIEGIKIYGTPWTFEFENMNPKCKAFTCTSENELMKKFNKIPAGIDILISHGPPFHILDKTLFYENVGSSALLSILDEIPPKYLFCGHIHEQGGKSADHQDTKCFNVSHVNEQYKPVNPYTRINIVRHPEESRVPDSGLSCE